MPWLVSINLIFHLLIGSQKFTWFSVVFFFLIKYKCFILVFKTVHQHPSVFLFLFMIDLWPTITFCSSQANLLALSYAQVLDSSNTGCFKCWLLQTSIAHNTPKFLPLFFLPCPSAKCSPGVISEIAFRPLYTGSILTRDLTVLWEAVENSVHESPE